MNLEFDFGLSPWEEALENMKSGGSLSAVRFLTLMEGEEEPAVEDALRYLEENKILLELSDLPKPEGTGEAAVRLKLEEKLVQEGSIPQGLPQSDPLRLYLEDLASVPVCGDVQLLAEALAQGDRSVVERLTALMLSHVVELAQQHTGKGVLLLDLIQEGSLGLWQGILSYTGGDFHAHCHWQIRWELARVITLQARDSGVGQKLRRAMEDLRSVDERLLCDLGRNPTAEELAQELHMSVEEVLTLSKMLDATRNLARAKAPEAPAEDDPEENAAVEDTAYFQTRQRIAELLSSLPEADARLLTLRFGLEGGKPLTPEETGMKLGLTPQEVVTREAAALSQLRGK